MTEQAERAKVLHAHIKTIVDNEKDNADDRAMLTILFYAGILAETLFEYEEPDIIIEQTFYRIADLLNVEPEEISTEQLDELMPRMDIVDYYTEKGRSLSLKAAEQLNDSLDDVHEIIIGLIISDLPIFGEDKNVNMGTSRCLRILMEAVIVTAIFEMASQEFCDILVEDFIGDGWPVDMALATLSSLVMIYGIESLQEQDNSIKDADELQNIVMQVIANEAKRHSIDDAANWASVSPVNDQEDTSHYKEMSVELRQPIEDFFKTVGFENKVGQAVAVGKAVGRMVAVSASEDAGYMPGPIGQMIVMRGIQSVISEIKGKSNASV